MQNPTFCLWMIPCCKWRWLYEGIERLCLKSSIQLHFFNVKLELVQKKMLCIYNNMNINQQPNSTHKETLKTIRQRLNDVVWINGKWG